jgi:hypothetical protein
VTSAALAEPAEAPIVLTDQQMDQCLLGASRSAVATVPRKQARRLDFSNDTEVHSISVNYGQILDSE